MTAFVLEQKAWNEGDYDRLAWNDATIHALAFDSDARRLLFDIDYVFGLEDPEEGEDSMRFWVAPCTLAFRDAHGLESRLGTTDVTGLRVAALVRNEPIDSGGVTRWRWSLDCDQGDISFHAAGFEQRLRREPTLELEPALSLGARGGIAFP